MSQNAKKIHKLEAKIRDSKKKLAKLHQKVKPHPVTDYVLKMGTKSVPLSKLFGKHSEMILIHNMGADCAYCALWADGFNGLRKHLENRCAFIVENDDSPAAQAKFKKAKGWDFTLVSSEGTPLKTDLGFRKKDEYAPGVTVLTKDKKGRITRTASTMFGPGDNYCAAWDLFDLLPKGAGDWSPKQRY